MCVLSTKSLATSGMESLLQGLAFFRFTVNPVLHEASNEPELFTFSEGKVS